MRLKWTEIAYFIVWILNGIGLAHGEIKMWRANEKDCPDRNARQLPQPNVPVGEAWRSYKSVPYGLRIQQSTIPEAGVGVVSDTFISRYTSLGVYEGEIVISPNDISDYAWEIRRGDNVYFYVDAFDDATANYPRFINCPLRKSQENVEQFQCYDKNYYVTSKDIYPGQELFVYYGDAYARTLDIDPKVYKQT